MCCMAVEETTKVCMDFKSLLDNLPNKLAKLRDEQKEYDRQLSDLLHDIELSETYDTRRGLKDAQLLRKILKRKREIKDELYLLTAINKQVCKGTIVRDLGNVINIAPSQDGREYGTKSNRFSQAN